MLVQEALTRLLPQLGENIVVRNAVTAAGATDILGSEPNVSLALLDLSLPDTRGLDLLADQMPHNRGVPVAVRSPTHFRNFLAPCCDLNLKGLALYPL